MPRPKGARQRAEPGRASREAGAELGRAAPAEKTSDHRFSEPPPKPQTASPASPGLVMPCIIQNLHFVQLRYFLDMAKCGIPYAEMCLRVDDDPKLTAEEKNEYLAFALQHGTLLVMAGNQGDFIKQRVAAFASAYYSMKAMKEGDL